MNLGLLAATVAPSAAQYICTPPNTEAEISVSSALTQRMELAGLLVSGVIAGDGEGKPKGFLKSKALITVDTEPGQAAGSFLGANAVKMQARAMPRNRERLG